MPKKTPKQEPEDNRRQLCIDACEAYLLENPLEPGKIITRNKDFLSGMVEVFNNLEKYGLKYSRPPKHLSKVEEVVRYLNEKAGTCFETNATVSIKLISARINEGRSVGEMKFVIDKKVGQWLNKPEMRPYLRPQTLFSEKFEQYLNEPAANHGTNTNTAGNPANKIGNIKTKGDAIQALDNIKFNRVDRVYEPALQP